MQILYKNKGSVVSKEQHTGRIHGFQAYIIAACCKSTHQDMMLLNSSEKQQFPHLLSRLGRLTHTNWCTSNIVMHHEAAHIQYVGHIANSTTIHYTKNCIGLLSMFVSSWSLFLFWIFLKLNYHLLIDDMHGWHKTGFGPP